MKKLARIIVVAMGFLLAKPSLASETLVEKSATIAAFSIITKLARLAEIAACDAMIAGNLKLLLSNPDAQLERLVSQGKINRATANKIAYFSGASFATALFLHAALEVNGQEVAEVGALTALAYLTYLAGQNAQNLNPLSKLAKKLQGYFKKPDDVVEQAN